MSLSDFSEELLLDIAEECGTDSNGENYLVLQNYGPSALLSKILDYIDLLEVSNISSLIWAASRGYLPLAKLLLNSGVDANLQTSQGYTALHFAAINNDVKMVELLLEQEDTDVNRQNGLFQTPLHCAAYHARPGVDPEVVVRLLLGKGADISLQGYKGYLAYEQAQGATKQVKGVLKPNGILRSVGKGGGKRRGRLLPVRKRDKILTC